jgi:hypothetical protein
MPSACVPITSASAAPSEVSGPSTVDAVTRCSPAGRSRVGPCRHRTPHGRAVEQQVSCHTAVAGAVPVELRSGQLDARPLTGAAAGGHRPGCRRVVERGEHRAARAGVQRRPPESQPAIGGRPHDRPGAEPHRARAEDFEPSQREAERPVGAVERHAGRSVHPVEPPTTTPSRWTASRPLPAPRLPVTSPAGPSRTVLARSTTAARSPWKASRPLPRTVLSRTTGWQTPSTTTPCRPTRRGCAPASRPARCSRAP